MIHSITLVESDLSAVDWNLIIQLNYFLLEVIAKTTRSKDTHSQGEHTSSLLKSFRKITIPT